jgi:hypothetical protein
LTAAAGRDTLLEQAEHSSSVGGFMQLEPEPLKVESLPSVAGVTPNRFVQYRLGFALAGIACLIALPLVLRAFLGRWDTGIDGFLNPATLLLAQFASSMALCGMWSAAGVGRPLVRFMVAASGGAALSIAAALLAIGPFRFNFSALGGCDDPVHRRLRRDWPLDRI